MNDRVTLSEAFQILAGYGPAVWLGVLAAIVTFVIEIILYTKGILFAGGEQKLRRARKEGKAVLGTLKDCRYQNREPEGKTVAVLFPKDEVIQLPVPFRRDRDAAQLQPGFFGIGVVVAGIVPAARRHSVGTALPFAGIGDFRHFPPVGEVDRLFDGEGEVLRLRRPAVGGTEGGGKQPEEAAEPPAL